MSLISEALKKAQKMRADPMAVASNSEGGNVARRGRPTPAKTVALAVAGVAALVVLVVVTTIVVMRLNAPPPLTGAKSAPAQPAANMAAPTTSPVSAAIPPVTAPASPDPVVVVPAPVASASTPGAVRTAPAANAGAKAPSAPSAKNAPAAQRNVTAPPVAPSVPVIASKPTAEPRVQAFVDAVRVTGIRSSGADSKVLMNDRVFRLNDIVDRSLGIRLTEVRTDSLTFVDENGFAYLKNF